MDNDDDDGGGGHDDDDGFVLCAMGTEAAVFLKVFTK